MERIDTHLHLIHPERSAYDWTAGIPVPANQGIPLDEILAGCSDHDLSPLYQLNARAAYRI